MDVENENELETEDISEVEDQESDTPPPPEGEPSKVKKANQEAQNLRKRLREAERKLEEADRAKLTEQERVAQDLARAQEAASTSSAALRKERVSNAVMRAATRLDLDPELADQLVRPESVEFDDEGQPSNVEDHLTELVKRWPHLKKTAVESPAKPAPGGPTNPSRGNSRAALTMDQVKAMTQTEIVARWDEVQAVLATKP